MAKYALTVGINTYGGGSDLYGCKNDALDFAAFLTARSFIVNHLHDLDATKANILARLRDLLAVATHGDVAVFSFSGHGSWVPDDNGDEADGRDEVICPADVMNGEYITDDELHEIFSDRARGVRLIFLSDSCHSGTVNRFASPMLASNIATRTRFLPPSNFLAGTSLRRAFHLSRTPATRRIGTSALLLSGCHDGEFSYDAWFGTRANGAFTRVAIDAAQNLVAGSSYAEWHRQIRQRLPSSEYPQTPQLAAAKYQREWLAFEEGR